VAGHQAVRCAAETAVGQEGDGVAESCADQSGGDGEHFAHARAAFWSFITNDDDVARLDFIFVDFGEGRFFAVEDASGATEIRSVVSRNLNDAAFGCQIASENDQAAGGLEGICYFADDFLFGFFFCGGGFLGERFSGNGDGFALQ
jgi:hypothetical protein